MSKSGYTALPLSHHQTVSPPIPQHEWRKDPGYANLKTFRYKVELGKPCGTPRASLSQRVKGKLLSLANRVADGLGVKGFRAAARYREAHLRVAHATNRFTRAVAARDFERLPDAFREMTESLRGLAERRVDKDSLKTTLREQIEFQMVHSEGEGVTHYADIDVQLLRTLGNAVQADDDAGFMTALATLQRGLSDTSVEGALVDIRKQARGVAEERSGCWAQGAFDADYLAAGITVLIDEIEKICTRDKNEQQKRAVEQKIELQSSVDKSPVADPTREREFIQRFGPAAFDEAGQFGGAKRILDGLDKSPNEKFETYLKNIKTEDPDARRIRENDEKLKNSIRNHEIGKVLYGAWERDAKPHNDRLDARQSFRAKRGEAISNLAIQKNRLEAKRLVNEAVDNLNKKNSRLQETVKFCENIRGAINLEVEINTMNSAIQKAHDEKSSRRKFWEINKPVFDPAEIAKKNGVTISGLTKYAQGVISDVNNSTYNDFIREVNLTLTNKISVDKDGKIYVGKNGLKVGVGALSDAERDEIYKKINSISMKCSYETIGIKNSDLMKKSTGVLENSEFDRLESARKLSEKKVRDRALKIKSEILNFYETAKSLFEGDKSSPSPYSFGFRFLDDDFRGGQISMDRTVRLQICQAAGVKGVTHTSQDQTLVWFDKVGADELREARNRLMFKLEEAIVRLSDDVVTQETLETIERAMNKNWLGDVIYPPERSFSPPRSRAGSPQTVKLS